MKKVLDRRINKSAICVIDVLSVSKVRISVLYYTISTPMVVVENTQNRLLS